MTKAELYLKQYEYADKRVKRLEEEYLNELILIDTIRSASDNDGMPHGYNINKPTEDKAIKLADKLQRLVDARIEAIKVRQTVFDSIMEVGGLEADVLIEKYINLQTWERVCLSVHYSWPTVRLAWHRGLDKIDEIISDTK